MSEIIEKQVIQRKNCRKATDIATLENSLLQVQYTLNM